MHSECSICLDVINRGQKVLKCNPTHCFHSKCIDKWLSKSDQCPICRKTVKNSFYVKAHGFLCGCMVCTYIFTYVALFFAFAPYVFYIALYLKKMIET